MRKSFFLMLLMLIFSVTFIYSTGNRINGAQNDVTFDETTLFGSRSMADGLALEFSIHSDYRLFWDTRYEFEAEPKLRTDFNFSQSEKRPHREWEYTGISFALKTDFSRHSSGHLNLDSSDTYGLSAIFKDVASRTEAGEEHSEVIYLSDYYDFYPFYVTIDLPVYPKKKDSGYMSDSYIEGVFEGVNELFKIPVADDYKLKICISKNSTGEVYGWEVRSLNERLKLLTKSAQTKDGCYFIINSRSPKGDTYDTSHIADSYGIYYLPYLEWNQKRHFSPDSLDMVYTLVPGTEIIELVANEEQSELLLLTIENQTCVLTVIDITTMGTLQRLELFNYPNDTGLAVYPYNGFFVLISNNYSDLAVVAQQSTGEYLLDFITESVSLKNAVVSTPDELAMAYDGKRLAIVSHGDADYIGYITSDFCVSIYNENGLAYLGNYKSSLAVGQDIANSSYLCAPIDYNPPSVYWKTEPCNSYK